MEKEKTEKHFQKRNFKFVLDDKIKKKYDNLIKVNLILFNNVK